MLRSVPDQAEECPTIGFARTALNQPMSGRAATAMYFYQRGVISEGVDMLSSIAGTPCFFAIYHDVRRLVLCWACFLVGLDFYDLLNLWWCEDVPLHASFDQARVAVDRC
jgi:hypothetical protein